MKWLTAVLGIIEVGFVSWLGMPVLLLGYGALCFFIFDHFHINDTDSQIIIAIAPFLILAYFVWKRQKQWEERDIPVVKRDTEKPIK